MRSLPLGANRVINYTIFFESSPILQFSYINTYTVACHFIKDFTGVLISPQPDLTEKKKLKNRHFSSDAEVIAAAETWLEGQLSELFFSGLQKLEFGRCSLFLSWSG